MIIFVGDKPSSKMKRNAKPFEGAACEIRLLSWIKKILTDDPASPYIFTKYAIINQCDYAWGTLYKCHLYGDKLIALGNNASKALENIPHFKLPHPSGLNRQINDKTFINKKLKECREWLNSK